MNFVTIRDLLLGVIVAAMIGLPAFLINIWHAKDRISPEPAPNRWLYWGGFVLTLASIVCSGWLRRFAALPDEYSRDGTLLWVAVFVWMGALATVGITLLARHAVNARERRRRVNARARWGMAGFVAALALAMGVGGCSAQQKTDLVQKEVQLAQAADEGLTFFQKQLALAQDVMTAYQAELAATAVDDKSRVKTQAKLAKAQAEVTKYQMYLALAKVGIKLVEAQAVPATQPAQ